MSKYVTCYNCGDRILAGGRAVHFPEGWYCKECGIEALWDEHGQIVYGSDCDADNDEIVVGDDGMDDRFERERNRKYGIDL